MTDFMTLLHNKLFWMFIGGYWVFSSFVGALPMPKEGQQVYKFFFSFFHSLAGNLNRAAVALKVPGSPQV